MIVNIRSASLVDQLFLNENDVERIQSIFHHVSPFPPTFPFCSSHSFAPSLVTTAQMQPTSHRYATPTPQMLCFPSQGLLIVFLLAPLCTLSMNEREREAEFSTSAHPQNNDRAKSNCPVPESFFCFLALFPLFCSVLFCWCSQAKWVESLGSFSTIFIFPSFFLGSSLFDF